MGRVLARDTPAPPPPHPISGRELRHELQEGGPSLEQAFATVQAQSRLAQANERRNLRRLLESYLRPDRPTVALSIHTVGPRPPWADELVSASGGPPMPDPTPHPRYNRQSQPFDPRWTDPGAQSHLQIQGAVAGNFSSVGTTLGEQFVAQVVTQFHDDDSWGIELTEGVQGNVSGSTLGLQGNLQVAVASAIVHAVQYQAFAQIAGGASANSGSLAQPMAQAQVGAQVAFEPATWLQFFVQVTVGATATTSAPGAATMALLPQAGLTAGITFDFGPLGRR